MKRRPSIFISLLIIFIAAAFIYIPAPAAGAGSNADASNSDAGLSLEESIAIALENNTNMKMTHINYEKKTVEKKEAKYTADKVEDKSEYIGHSFEMYLAQYLSPRQKEAEELIAEKNLALEEQNLRLEVEKAYYNVLRAEDNVKNAEIQLKRAEEQLKNAEVSFSHGVVAKDTLLMAQYGVANAEANLASAKKSLELARMNFNKVLGREISIPVKLTTRFIYEPVSSPNLEESINHALTVRPEVISAREMREVAKLNLDLTGDFYSANTFLYKKAKLDLENADLGVKEAEDAVKLAVNAAYLSMEEAAQKVNAYKKMKETAQETYRITELKHNAGTATIFEVLQALESLRQAELAYTSAVFDYNTAKAEFDNWVGKGLD